MENKELTITQYLIVIVIITVITVFTIGVCTIIEWILK